MIRSSGISYGRGPKVRCSLPWINRRSPHTTEFPPACRQAARRGPGRDVRPPAWGRPTRQLVGWVGAHLTAVPCPDQWVDGTGNRTRGCPPRPARTGSAPSPVPGGTTPADAPPGPPAVAGNWCRRPARPACSRFRSHQRRPGAGVPPNDRPGRRRPVRPHRARTGTAVPGFTIPTVVTALIWRTFGQSAEPGPINPGLGRTARLRCPVVPGQSSHYRSFTGMGENGVKKT